MSYRWAVKSWCYFATRKSLQVLSWSFVRLQIWPAPGAAEPAGAAVLVANHISHFDPIYLGFAFKRVIDWMTTAEFYANPLTGAWLRAVNTFPVDRSRPDRRALRWGGTAACRADGGDVSRRRHSGRRLLHAGRGRTEERARRLWRDWRALRSFRVLCSGPDRLYAKRSWRPGPPRTPVWVTVGAPFSVTGLASDEADARMADTVRDLYTATIAHFSLGPDDLPTTPQKRKGRDANAPA